MILGQRTKIPHAAWCSQKKKKRTNPSEVLLGYQENERSKGGVREKQPFIIGSPGEANHTKNKFNEVSVCFLIRDHFVKL